MNSISPNLNIMIKASQKASKTLIRDFGEIEKLQVSVKGPSNFVSNADTKAEKIIIEELMKAKKNYSIISEEDGSKINSDSENVWIIDPIDGTSNFLHGIPHFAISIALKSNNEIISGLIYDPIKDEMFYAEKNSGAFFNNQRIKVSKKKEIEIIDANQLAFTPNERCAPTGTLNQTRLSLPDRRGKGKIIDGSTNDAVMQLVKILREQEKVV